MVWNHDFALTENHMVFVLDPLRPNIPTLLRTRSLAQALEHQTRNGSTRFALVPRDGSKPRIIEHEALTHIHVTNAFEDGSDTVVEFFRFEDSDIFGKLGKAWQDPSDPTDPRAHLTIDEWPRGHLSRFRISKSGRITETVLSATAPMEFPQYDWRRSTLEHNVTYACKATEDVGHYNAVTRIDHRTGDQTTFDFGRVEVRTGPAAAWTQVWQCSGALPKTRVELDLPQLAGAAQAQVRFRVTSDTGVVGDGVRIDDVLLEAASATCRGAQGAVDPLFSSGFE